MNIGLHHLVKKYKLREHSPISEYSFHAFVDHFIYVIGLFSVAILVPQFLGIFYTKSAAGVSLITWVGFMVSSTFWLIYGIIHKQKPIIVTNTGALIIDFLIVGAIIFYSRPPRF